MPLGETDSAKTAFTGIGKLEIPRLKKKKACSSSKADSSSPSSSIAQLRSFPANFAHREVDRKKNRSLKPHRSLDSSCSDFVLVPLSAGTRNANAEFTRPTSRRDTSDCKYGVASCDKQAIASVSDSCGPDTDHYPKKRKHSLGSRISMLSRTFLSSKKKHNSSARSKTDPRESRNNNQSRPSTPTSCIVTQSHDNLESVSHQPDLSDLLSGSVKSSKLLSRGTDFIPYAVLPDASLRRKSKSLSDLANKNTKLQKYLDRRQVIHMDPNDKDCCCHTEVAPSSMMALAMELLESKHSKAADLFRKSKLDENERDSILPKLWVVPKLGSDSRTPDIKQASHLQPTRGNVSTVVMRSKSSASARPNINRQGTVLQSVGTGICRKSGYAYPTAKCIPTAKHPADNYACFSPENERRYEVPTDAVVNDLRTLTVTDLVGSPDTKASPMDTEDSDASDTSQILQPQSHMQTEKRTAANNGPIERNESRVNESTNGSSKRCDDFTMHDSLLRNEYPRNIDVPSRALHMNGAGFCSSARVPARDREQSASSSLTTVSSLSSSSNSLHHYDDRRIVGSPRSINKDSNIMPPNVSVLQEVNDVAAPMTNKDQQSKSGNFQGTVEPPAPPKRGKSLGIMDKIRNSGGQKQLSTRANRLTTDCGNKVPISRTVKMGEFSKTSTDRMSPRVSDNKLIVESCGNVGAELAQPNEIDYSTLECGGKDSVSGIEPRVLCRDQCQTLYAIPPPEHDSHSNSSGRQTAGNEHTSFIGSSSNDCARPVVRIPSDELPVKSEIRRDRLIECVDISQDKNMDREKWFRNGRISVVDGSRVALARTPFEEGSRFAEKRNSHRSLSNLFISDIIGGERPSSSNTPVSTVEETVVPAASYGITENAPASGNQVVAEDISKISACGQEAVEPTLPDKSQRNTSFDAIVNQQFENMRGGSFSNSSSGALGEVSCGASSILSKYHEPRKQSGKEGSKSSFRNEPVLVTSTCYISTNARDASSHTMPKNFNVYPKPFHAVHKSERSSTTVATTSPINFDHVEEKSLAQLEMVPEMPKTKRVGECERIERHELSLYELENRDGPIYSSTIKIIVGDKEHESVKKVPDYQTAVRNANGTSTLNEKKVCEMSVTNVRVELDPDMKQSEMQTLQHETPLHSAVDESDFSGVVDGPTKNVKEIRAMFKARDHANYAKPKQILKKSPPPAAVYAKPTLRPEKDSAAGSNRNSAEVQQQVLGLFKGALEIEQDPQQPSELITNGKSDERSDYQSSLTHKDKIANFNQANTAPQKPSSNGSGEEKSDAPYAEIIKNTPTAPVANGHERKSSVKQEKVLAESYDESLDQFYDVFDQLTAT